VSSAERKGKSPPLLAQCVLDTCPFLGYLLLPKRALSDQPHMLVKPARGKLRCILPKGSKLKKRI
jgi:hypothetical protein